MKEQLSGFRITDRDIEVLKAVFRCGRLTTAQIEKRLFLTNSVDDQASKYTRCRPRLRMLFHNGFLHREEQPSRLSDGWRPLVYSIDKRAIPILAEEYGVFREDIVKALGGKKVSAKYLDHLLATNDIRIAIELAVERDDHVLRRWLDEGTLKKREMRDTVEISGSRGGIMEVSIVPDGYCLITAGDHDYHHLLEIDRGTETIMSSKFGRRDFSRKINGYLAYLSSGGFQERYQANSMRILVVTTSLQRLTNMKEMTEQTGGREQFWFTTFDQVTSCTVLTEPIWSVATKDGLHSLIW